jgi:hypothetical protein
VFTARYALSPYIKQIGFVFEGLIITYEYNINTSHKFFRFNCIDVYWNALNSSHKM